MDYYSRIKPVLNKISELNLFDSLEVIHEDIAVWVDDKSIPQGKHVYTNAIQPYFSDFLISNIFRYSRESGTLNLRDNKIRDKICIPINELFNEVNKYLMDQNPFIWINSYVFNQENMRTGDHRSLFYRYYYIYKSPKIDLLFKENIGVDIDSYFLMSYYVYEVFKAKNRFFFSKERFFPTQLSNDRSAALHNIINRISSPVENMKKMCHDYCVYDENMFHFYNDSPIVRYPIIDYGGNLYCIVPNYIISATLNQLYFILDSPNTPSVSKTLSERFEKYVGEIFCHYLAETNIHFSKEILYKDHGNNKKTSDWILWNNDEIAFLDCKMKSISTKGKSEVKVDVDFLNRIESTSNFSRQFIHNEIECLPSGITKDIIDLGVGIGKIFVSYNDYVNNKVETLPYMEGKKFYAYLLTFEETFGNTQGYKEHILKIANSYVNFKLKKQGGYTINEEDFKIISINTLEEDILTISQSGKICLLGSKIEDKQTDSFLIEKFKENIQDPLNKDLG